MIEDRCHRFLPSNRSRNSTCESVSGSIVNSDIHSQEAVEAPFSFGLPPTFRKIRIEPRQKSPKIRPGQTLPFCVPWTVNVLLIANALNVSGKGNCWTASTRWDSCSRRRYRKCVCRSSSLSRKRERVKNILLTRAETILFGRRFQSAEFDRAESVGNGEDGCVRVDHADQSRCQSQTPTGSYEILLPFN